MSDMTQQANRSTEKGPRVLRAIPHVGLLAALAALAGASCCAVPLLLVWLGVSSAWIANLEIFVAYRQPVTAFAAIVVVLGWVIALRRRASARTLAIIFVASAIVVSALLVAHYEVELTRYVTALRRR